jgi:hypothetical protein
MDNAGDPFDEVPVVPPVVTLAAPYGAGGSVVGPRVAERPGAPFLGVANSSAAAWQWAVVPVEREREDRR